MAEREELLTRLASAIALSPPEAPLSVRLCVACRDLSGADGAAVTVAYNTSDRITLSATDEVARRLEDLQDVLGEGPGHLAARSGRIEVCRVPGDGPGRWPQFAQAAEQVLPRAVVHAVPMRPYARVFGVLSLYRAQDVEADLALDPSTLLTLAAAAAAALIRDPTALDVDIAYGPWSSRSQVHQATGMVVAQLGLTPDDALAVLRAHAYAGATTLADVAEQVLDRRLRFTDGLREGD